MGITRYFDPNTLEELRLKTGYVRVQRIIRSESFRKNYALWRSSQLKSFMLEKLRSQYESSFYFDNSEEVKVQRTGGHDAISFQQLSNDQSTQASFILEFLKDNCQKVAHFQCYRTQRWRRLIPDEGVELCERYVLRRYKGWFQSMMPSRWLDTDHLVLELKLLEEQSSSFNIKWFPAKENSLVSGIDELMQKLLKQCSRTF